MRKTIVIYILLISVFATCFAQSELFLKKEFIWKGDTLKYRILFPENYNRNKVYPMLVFLHGSGERGNDNEKQLVHGSSIFLNSKNRTEFPAIVIFPQCPSNDSWVHFKDKKSNTFEFSDIKGPTKPLALTKTLIDFYKKTEAVDTKKIYISGLSLGGMGTYDLICRYPRLFAAAIPICGAVNEKRLMKVRKMPIRIYHGDNDESVSVEYARNAYIELKANGSKNVQYFEFPGVGHNSWDRTFAEPDFLKWLFNQHKGL
ncbi:MAG: phospholipase [Paludibacter sp.]|nr:phospholipase [Paludibacter sp.]